MTLDTTTNASVVTRATRQAVGLGMALALAVFGAFALIAFGILGQAAAEALGR